VRRRAAKSPVNAARQGGLVSGAKGSTSLLPHRLSAVQSQLQTAAPSGPEFGGKLEFAARIINMTRPRAMICMPLSGRNAADAPGCETSRWQAHAVFEREVRDAGLSRAEVWRFRLPPRRRCTALHGGAHRAPPGGHAPYAARQRLSKVNPTGRQRHLRQFIRKRMEQGSPDLYYVPVTPPDRTPRLTLVPSTPAFCIWRWTISRIRSSP